MASNGTTTTTTIDGTMAANDSMTTSEPLNVIIPIGGIGSRFAKQGYRYPKPLINMVGRPILLWLIDNLSLRAHDTLWIAINEEIEHVFGIQQLVRKNFPDIDFILLPLRHQTRGASETLYIATQSMSQKHLSRRTVSLDCDTIYWCDLLQQIRSLPAGYGGCFYFADQAGKPIFSYLKTKDEHGLERIVDIQEKKAISNKANTGAYLFPSAAELKRSAAETLDQRTRLDIGEYYTSHMILLMIQQGIPFLALPIDGKAFSCVGTPEQLQLLLAQLKPWSRLASGARIRPRRFCFDLDMTLVGVPAVPGDYSTCPPIEKNIRLVQQLFRAGHHIIIQTARRMRSQHGNVGSVVADIGLVTLQQLAKYQIPYHDMHFGKPYADAYIDDLAVNSNLDTMREIGWLLDDDTASALCHHHAGANKAGMMAARDFNTIQIVADKVIKSSRSPNILGELYFYSHMPKALEAAFPTCFNVDFIPETGTYSATMERRSGLTFSHLLVGRSITHGRLLAFLRALHMLHTAEASHRASIHIPPALEAEFEAHSLDRAGHQVNIYANYGAKLRSRYAAHRKTYDALGPLAASLFTRLHDFLDTYEAEDKGVHAHVIHGDPVFSNAILSQDEKLISFIDVRCQLDSTLTPEGDINYDLAKVLQSLCGYDHVLFMSANNNDDGGGGGGGGGNLSAALDDDAPPLLDEPDRDLLAGLRDSFFHFLETTYDERLHRKTLFRITASLFFTLIPLHRPALGPVFLRLCRDALESAGSIRAGLGARSCSTSSATTTTSRTTPSRAASLQRTVRRPSGPHAPPTPSPLGEMTSCDDVEAEAEAVPTPMPMPMRPAANDRLRSPPRVALSGISTNLGPLRPGPAAPAGTKLRTSTGTGTSIADAVPDPDPDSDASAHTAGNGAAPLAVRPVG